MNEPAESAILQAVLSPLDDLRPVTARLLLEMKFKKPQQARVSRLLKRSRQGKLTASERVELDGHIQLGNLLTLMHSKARLALKRPPARARRKSA